RPFARETDDRGQPRGVEPRTRLTARGPNENGGTMNIVVAIIRPSKVDEVKEALTAINVHGMTVTEVKGFGRTGGKSEVYRGSAYVVDFVPKIRIEVVVPSEMVREVIDTVVRTAKTGKVG